MHAHVTSGRVQLSSSALRVERTWWTAAPLRCCLSSEGVSTIGALFTCALVRVKLSSSAMTSCKNNQRLHAFVEETQFALGAVISEELVEADLQILG